MSPLTNDDIRTELTQAVEAIHLANSLKSIAANGVKTTETSVNTLRTKIDEIKTLLLYDSHNRALQKDRDECFQLMNADTAASAARATHVQALRNLQAAEARAREVRTRIQEMKRTGDWQRREEASTQARLNRTAKPSAPTLPSDSPQAWRRTVQNAFADLPNMHTCPSPPASACFKLSCLKEKRSLHACSWNIRSAFLHTSGLDLKTERLMWHPDRFSVCPEEHREAFKRMAQEVIVVVDAMWREKLQQ